jgi:hypothetical protein
VRTKPVVCGFCDSVTHYLPAVGDIIMEWKLSPTPSVATVCEAGFRFIGASGGEKKVEPFNRSGPEGLPGK